MSIEIKVGSGEVAEEEKPVQASMSLHARKSLDGNIMIFDHDDIDIVILPELEEYQLLLRSFLLS